MNQERTDAPKLDLPPMPVGDDVLQVGPADVPAEPSGADADAFAMRTAAAKPALPKPKHAVSVEANAGVIAALMGKPIPKISKKPEPAAPSRTQPLASSTLDVDVPVATESVIDFDTSDEVEGKSPFPGESTLAGVAPTDEPVAPPVVEPIIGFELTQTALPESFVATEAVVSGVSRSVVEPPAVAFEPVKPVVAKAVPVVPTPAAVSAAIPSTLLPTVIVPPALVASATPPEPPKSAEPTDRVVEPQLAVPVVEIKATPRRPTTPVAGETPKRPKTPVAPVWPSAPVPTVEVPATVVPARVPPKPQSERPKPARPNPAEPEVPAGRSGAWWTIPMTFLGIAIVACAVIIPAADETRRDAHELAKIEQDVDYFQQQSAVNADFLDRVNTDATLAERLALRQLHQTRAGVKIAPLTGPADRFGASPFAITKLDPPQPLPAYQSIRSPLNEWFLGDKRPQQMAAMGLLITGIGVLVGGGRRRTASA